MVLLILFENASDGVDVDMVSVSILMSMVVLVTDKVLRGVGE
jgi:hypothetical protein